MPITAQELIDGTNAPFDVYKPAVTNEAAGVHHFMGLAAGVPGAMVIGAPGLNGVAVVGNALGGAATYTNPVAPKNKYCFAMNGEVAAGIAAVNLVDLLWYNTGLVVTTTTAQAITPAALPSRCFPSTLDNDAAVPDALGFQCLWGLLVTTATTNAGAIANITASYTNTAGVAGRTATMPSFPATAVAGTFVPFTLQAGDTGARSVQSVTLVTSLVTGAVSLVCLRQIARGGTGYGGAGSISADFIALGRPRVFDNSALYTVVFPTGTVIGASRIALTLADADPA
jgi:hypothetical protein